jgi:hypothetical protein
MTIGQKAGTLTSGGKGGSGGRGGSGMEEDSADGVFDITALFERQ